MYIPYRKRAAVGGTILRKRDGIHNVRMGCMFLMFLGKGGRRVEMPRRTGAGGLFLVMPLSVLSR
jgi:hypothetical protein